jgi:hypothetical protein
MSSNEKVDMVAKWLMDGIDFPEGTLPEHLEAARELMPASLLEEAGMTEELAACVESEYRHFTLDCLQMTGSWAEEAGRDAELSVEFWVRLALAANQMFFPELPPYCLGKAQRRPKRDPADLAASVATLPQAVELPEGLKDACDEAARMIREADSAMVGPLERSDLAVLSGRLRDGLFDTIGPEFSSLFSEAFDDLFAAVTDPDFPAEHAEHAWSVIAPNPFRVVLNDGLTVTTRAEFWWRA